MIDVFGMIQAIKALPNVDCVTLNFSADKGEWWFMVRETEAELFNWLSPDDNPREMVQSAYDELIVQAAK